jgi:hypothetical protein
MYWRAATGKIQRAVAARLLLVVLSAVTAACVPDSRYPLTSFDSGTIDADLYGSWYWNDEQESGYLHFGREPVSGKLQLLMVEINHDGDLGITEMLGHSSRLGDNRYLNLKFTPPQDGIDGYLLIKYEITPKGLGIAFMDPGVVEKGIAAGEVAGRVEQSGGFTAIRLTDSPQGLQHYFRDNDKRLFADVKFLSRLELPGL